MMQTSVGDRLPPHRKNKGAVFLMTSWFVPANQNPRPVAIREPRSRIRGGIPEFAALLPPIEFHSVVPVLVLTAEGATMSETLVLVRPPPQLISKLLFRFEGKAFFYSRRVHGLFEGPQ